MLEQALVTLHGLLVSSMDILTCKSTHLVFLLMLFVLCPFFHSSYAARDTISQGQSITITETIVSADAKFELGFFRPGRNSTNQYVGIWFKKAWLGSTQRWNLYWSQPKIQCEVYAFCGAFGLCNQQASPFCSCIRGFEPRSSGNWELNDYSAGCARKTPLQCENHNQAAGDPDEFVMLSNVQLPVNPESFESGSIEECKSACLNSCSCTGYALNDSRCSVWNGDLMNLRQLADYNHSARDIYVKVAASVLNPKRSKRQLWIILVLAVSLTAISSAAGLHPVDVGEKTKKKRSTQQGIVLKKGAEKGRNKEMELPLFSFSSVSAATNNFTTSNKLGEGGFGPVYKGSLLNGQLVAVKMTFKKIWTRMGGAKK